MTLKITITVCEMFMGENNRVTLSIVLHKNEPGQYGLVVERRSMNKEVKVQFQA